MSALSKFSTMNRPLEPGGVGGAVEGRVTAGGAVGGGVGTGAGVGVAGASVRDGSGARGPIETGGIGGGVGSVCTVTVGAGTGIGGGVSARWDFVEAHPAAAQRRTTVAMKPLTLLLRRIARARRQTT
jgi:hypothetical protein